MELILASGSPRRKEILERNGIKFRIIKAENDGESDKKDTAGYVMELSENKAREVFEKLPDDFEGVVLGADTVVAKDGKILGKPADRDDSIAMIKAIAGDKHSVLTGITLIYKKAGKMTVKSGYEETFVYVKAMTDEEIRGYADTGEGMDKAGSYAIQGIFGKYIDHYDGDYDNVVGLPYNKLKETLDEMSISINDFK